MKIVLFILSLVVLSMPLWFAQATDCSGFDGLKGFTILNKESTQDEIQGTFADVYNYHVCEKTLEIDTEAFQYNQWIKKIEGKNLVEVIYDVWETFCREYFGKCNENSLYWRYRKACNDARTQTIDELQSATDIEKSIITINSELLAGSFAGVCENEAIKKLQAYKEIAVQEVARYATKIVENSNKTYLTEAHQQFNKVIEKFNTVAKMFGDIARSFQAFTGQAHV